MALSFHLIFRLFPLLRPRDHPLGCIITLYSKKKKADGITRLTSRQTVVGRQERINYCPLTVSFPAPELDVAVPVGGDPACNIQFHAPFCANQPSSRTEGQLLSFDCPLEFRASHRAGKTNGMPSNCRELIDEILTGISDLFNSRTKS